jgi:hypothetical protein
MKRLLLILLCLPMIGFGQKSGIIGWNKEGVFAYRNITEHGMVGTIDVVTIKDPRDNQVIAEINSDGAKFSPKLVKELLLKYRIKERILINNRVDDIMHLDCLKSLLKKENDDFQIIGYQTGTGDNRFMVHDEGRQEQYVIINIEKRYIEDGGPDAMGNPVYIYYNDYYACKLF